MKPMLLIATILACVGTQAHAGEILINFESPKEAIYAGIDTVRGWAISTAGIQRVELYIDSQFISVLPQGGRRDDVGDAFPAVPGSRDSGFAFAFNYASLPTGFAVEGIFISTVGIHTATVKVVDNDGAEASVTNMFGNTRFLTDKFITEGDIALDSSLVNLDSATFFSGDFPLDEEETIDAEDHASFYIANLVVDGTSYVAIYTWLTEAQQIRPVLIVPTAEVMQFIPSNRSLQITAVKPQDTHSKAIDLYRKLQARLRR